MSIPLRSSAAPVKSSRILLGARVIYVPTGKSVPEDLPIRARQAYRAIAEHGGLTPEAVRQSLPRGARNRNIVSGAVFRLRTAKLIRRVPLVTERRGTSAAHD